MIIDVVYVAWDRYEFTRFSFGMLLANTDWRGVRTLQVYDNGSTDGTRELLIDMIRSCEKDIAIEFYDDVCEGPVDVMNHYIDTQAHMEPSDVFAKIDSDIIVPPGWLDTLAHVLVRDGVDVLGMESGRIAIPQEDLTDDGHQSEHARWIGGVGLIRTVAIASKPTIKAGGRFGWTEFQREYRNLRIAWVSPDLALTELTRIPFEPWRSLSDEYRQIEHERGDLERDWPRYHEVYGEPYWGWWKDLEHVVPDPEKAARIARWER